MGMATQCEREVGESYTHVPMFYSDLFELGYEAVGELNSELEIVTELLGRLEQGRNDLSIVIPEENTNEKESFIRFGGFWTKHLDGLYPSGDDLLR